MRYIDKQNCPLALTVFLAAQLPLRVNLDYENGFTRKSQLRQELIAEQRGLCGYTGAALDERLTGRNQNTAPGPVSFKPHTEHLKPQSISRQELIAQGKIPGCDLGEDMDHRNMIAALLVESKDQRGEDELFGAAAKKNHQIPVLPTHVDCGSHFCFFNNGTIEGTDADGKTTVTTLRLDHRTLNGWRSAAIDEFFFSDDVILTPEYLCLLADPSLPRNGPLAEFVFVIQSIARSMLQQPVEMNISIHKMNDI